MTTPMWVIILPIGISCVALIVSGLTYRLAIKRDEEAREFVLMERQHDIVTMYHKLMSDLEVITNKYGDTPETIFIRGELKRHVTDIHEFDFRKGPTRNLRRSMEKLYRNSAIISVLIAKLPRELEANAAKAMKPKDTPVG